VPGVTSDKKLKPGRLRQGAAVSIAGLTPGVAYKLAECCHPVPGDRIIGLARENVGIEVHTIDCPELANGVDADWIDLRWQEDSEGGSARLSVVVPNEPGTLAEMAGILAANDANIMNLRISAREGDFHTYEVMVEVQDVHHLMRILSALRASDTVVQAERG
jgi:GTP diphosphokinase / guanosine-3',5'-bis(diphosphate) 3'-diphosphatase